MSSCRRVNTYGEPLLSAVADGVVDEKLVDRALHRVLTQKCELGLLDADWAPAEPTEIDLDPPESRAVALELARRSVVLLANDGTLPLPEGTRVAVVGPRADTPEAMVGCYSFPRHVLLHYPGLELGVDIPTVRDALAETFEVTYALGCPVLGGDRRGHRSGRRRTRHRQTSAWPCSATRRACSATARRGRAAMSPTSVSPAGRRSCWTLCWAPAHRSSPCSSSAVPMT